jgi:tetratricopeptide (TPR) repeat protein
VMERVYSSTIDSHVSALAHHLFQAGASVDQEKAIHFLSEAARQASGSAAHEEALRHLDDAISLLDEERTPRIADLLSRRADALLSLSRNGEAVQEYERALTLFESLRDHVRFAETCIRLHIVHTWATEFGKVRSVIDRLEQYSRGGPAFLRSSVLAMQAHSASATGEIDKSLDLLEELHRIAEDELPRSVLAFAADQEMFTRYGAGEFGLCAVAARKATAIYEQSGDVFSKASVEMGLFWPPLICGNPAEAERQVVEAIARAARIQNDVAKAIALWVLAGVHISNGKLESAEETAREALALMDTSHFGWAFVAELTLGGILLYRGQTEEALGALTKAAAKSAPLYRGYAEGLLALGSTAAGMNCAAEARAGTTAFLPRPGVSRSIGAWNPVLSLTEALCLSGHRQDAGRLQVEAERIANEWDCNHAGFPVRTAAGIAAACTGDYTQAEQHHRAAIERMEAVPYVTAQPIARYWYADMLVQRRGAGDVRAAKAVLEESVTKSDRIGVILYARLGRQRLSEIA